MSSRFENPGIDPKIKPVTTETPSVKKSTFRSIVISFARAVKRSVNATSSLSVNADSSSPSNPPVTASSRLSVSS